MRRGVKMAGRLWNQAVTLERVPSTHTKPLAPFTVSFQSSGHPLFILFIYFFFIGIVSSLNVLRGVFGGFLCSSNVYKYLKCYELRGMDGGMSMNFVDPLLL